MIAALEQLRDTPTEYLDIRKGAALILHGTGKFEFIDLLFFWSERLSSVFLYSETSSGQRNNILSNTESILDLDRRNKEQEI